MSGHGSAGEQAGPNGEGSKLLLPYGTSLHYQNCGCPPGWRSAGSPADVVDLLVQKAFQAYQAGRLVATRPLRVCYFLPHHNVTGGMKCLVEHVRLLKARGKASLGPDPQPRHCPHCCPEQKLLNFLDTSHPWVHWVCHDCASSIRSTRVAATSFMAVVC